ncbi:hypothetical protein B5X24_HaOG209419 [Helicoverpa armigera]|uniref:Uncharacterized protein n=1 Tax=Helicoverpa armigera TaxID=29058 RepID=A0A2W1BGZ8_HELAM|nr:hypothetical protein B5X24_HaOG209419 [Helicoverpa armigera]
MSRFVVILAFGFLALTLAKPATNYGNSSSTGGNSKIQVADNSTFGNDAFGSGNQQPAPPPPPQQPQPPKIQCGLIGSLLNPFLCRNY